MLGNIYLALLLLAIATALLLISRYGLISNSTVEQFVKIANIMSFVTAIIVLVWPLIFGNNNSFPKYEGKVELTFEARQDFVDFLLQNKGA